MTLGELKKSLTRFDSDMDDSEIILTYMSGSKEEHDMLAFVAYTEVKNSFCVVLGSMDSAVNKLKNGTLKYSNGTKPSDIGFNIND